MQRGKACLRCQLKVGRGTKTVWPRWGAASTCFRLGPRDSPKPYINIFLIKGQRKQIRFQAAARCCLVFRQLLSTRRRDCCPSGSFPKGVVLEGRWRGLGVDRPRTGNKVPGAEKALGDPRRRRCCIQHPSEWTAPTQTPRVTHVGA